MTGENSSLRAASALGIVTLKSEDDVALQLEARHFVRHERNAPFVYGQVTFTNSAKQTRTCAQPKTLTISICNLSLKYDFIAELVFTHFVNNDRRWNKVADNLNNRGPADRSRINVHEQWELDYWCKELGVTPAKLKAAVSAVGVSAAAVRRYLGQ